MLKYNAKLNRIQVPSHLCPRHRSCKQQPQLPGLTSFAAVVLLSHEQQDDTLISSSKLDNVEIDRAYIMVQVKPESNSSHHPSPNSSRSHSPDEGRWLEACCH